MSARIAAGLIAGLALAACGGGSSHHKTTTSRSTSASTSSAAPAKPIATAFYNTPGTGNTYQPMQVSIYDLRRQGPFLVLDFGLRCLKANCNASVFSQPTGVGEQQYIASGKYGNTAAGVVAVDPQGQQEYLAVRDAQNRPFTSEMPLVKDTRTYLAWVRYPAPPASVTSMDIAFPVGGPVIAHVPISHAASGPAAGASLVAAAPAPFSQTPSADTTSGLTLSIENLLATVGNPTGSDSESATQSTVNLRSDVLFHFAKSTLTSRARAIIRGVATQIRSRAKGTVRVTGYTDSIGSNAVNVPLSQARARAVAAVLKAATPGIGYAVAGRGSADPVAPNTTPTGSDNPAGRALNRRVTIAFDVKRRAVPQAPRAPTPTASATPGSGQSIAFKAGTTGFKSSYRLRVASLAHDGDLLLASLDVTCVHGSGAVCANNGDLQGTATTPPLYFARSQIGNESTAWTASGFYLQDPRTATEYIPLHTSAGFPLTGAFASSIPNGQTYQYWIYFPGPPAGASHITLVTPQGGARISVALGAGASSP